MKRRVVQHQKKLDAVPLRHVVESVVGCKWSLHVLDQIRKGNVRPGTLVRSAPGLTSKVLQERLQKMLRFGILKRTVFAQVPPHVEYNFTAFGRKFLKVLDLIVELERE